MGRTLQRRALLLALLALLAAGPADDPPARQAAVLRPDERLEQCSGATVRIDEAGVVTLAASGGGSLELRDAQDGMLVSDPDGWVSLDLPPGSYRLSLSDGPATVTVLRGTFPPGGEGRDAIGLLNEGFSLHYASDWEGARRSLLASLAADDLQPAHRALGEVFLADLLRRDGRLEDARRLLVRSGAAAVEAMPAVAPLVASCAGGVALEARDLPAARAAFERLAALASDPGQEALAISWLARVAEAEGELDEARSLHEQALGRSAEGVAPHDAVEVRFHAARYAQERGELGRAAALLQEAAALAAEWEQQLIVQGQLGVVHLEAGRLGPAGACLDRVAAMAAEHGPSPHDRVILRNQAALAFELGDYGRAREHLQELLRLPLPPAERADALADLATLLSLHGDDDGAAALYQEALAGLPADHPERWRMVLVRAFLERRRGAAQAAAASAGEALALARAQGQSLAEIRCLVTLADARVLLGVGGQAREEAADAVARLAGREDDALLAAALHTLALAELSLGNLDEVAALLDRAWDVLGSPGIVSRPALEAARLRARFSELSEWGQVAMDLTARRLAAADAARRPEVLAAGLAEVSRWKNRSLLDGLGGGGATAPEDLLPRLGELLGERRLVQYASGTERLYAFVVERGTLRLADLGLRAEVERDVAAFVAGLSDPFNPAGLHIVVPLGRALHRRLLEPLGPPTPSLVVVPDGDLCRLPFEALVAAAPEQPASFAEVTFVLDGTEVGYAPSPTVLLALARRGPVRPPRRALLLGDPLYAGEGEPTLLASRQPPVGARPRLTHSRGEVVGLARMLLGRGVVRGESHELARLALLERERSGLLETGTVQLRLGADASPAAFAELAPGTDLIHVAAHGEVDPWNPRRTGLVLAWDEEHQGLFTLADIASLELDDALVVLSACRTADGRILRGEGVQSMAQAFLLAGARGVVATLWPVEDAAAQRLMERFGQGLLLEGESPLAALRAARLALRHGAALPRPAGGGEPDARPLALGDAARVAGPEDPEDPLRGLRLAPRQRRAPSDAGHPALWAPFLYTGDPGAVRE